MTLNQVLLTSSERGESIRRRGLSFCSWAVVAVMVLGEEEGEVYRER